MADAEDVLSISGKLHQVCRRNAGLSDKGRQLYKALLHYIGQWTVDVLSCMVAMPKLGRGSSVGRRKVSKRY